MRFSLLSKGLIAFLVCCLCLPAAFAIGVKPLRTEILIAPGEKKSVTITVINDENATVKAKPSLDVYTKNDAEGFPITIDNLTKNDPRDIRDWIKFDEDEITLKPKEERAVSFTIQAPKDAEPGGRYASMVYEPLTTESKDTVSVKPRVASLLLITVAGHEIKDGEVTRFSLDDQTSGQPFGFAVEFKNKGNVHVKPKGSITLFDESGSQLKSVARYEDPETKKIITGDTIPVNVLGGNVLPDSSRIFHMPWEEGVRTGKFKAKLQLTFGADKVSTEKSLDFSLDPEVTVKDFKLTNTDKGTGFLVKVQNSGNTYERLAGLIEITNAFDYKMAEAKLPTDLSALVKPGETKELQVPWLASGKKIPDGEYIAKLDAVYGPNKAQIHEEISIGEGGSLLKSPVFWGALVLILVAGALAYKFIPRRKLS